MSIPPLRNFEIRSLGKLLKLSKTANTKTEHAA